MKRTGRSPPQNRRPGPSRQRSRQPNRQRSRQRCLQRAKRPRRGKRPRSPRLQLRTARSRTHGSSSTRTSGTACPARQRRERSRAQPAPPGLHPAARVHRLPGPRLQTSSCLGRRGLGSRAWRACLSPPRQWRGALPRSSRPQGSSRALKPPLRPALATGLRGTANTQRGPSLSASKPHHSLLHRRCRRRGLQRQTPCRAASWTRWTDLWGALRL
mmetsp:Transcript_3613/g.11298  ORF Transcript_3613/g.11298 Transcript_3613/m.11298 type:complete len:215 (+) Transcript_3613:1161-1805(+)